MAIDQKTEAEEPPGTVDQLLERRVVGPIVTLDPRQSFVRTVDRTIVFEYRNPWALLSLMNDHKTSSREFKDYVDPAPETLRFDVPTIFDVATAIDATGRVLYDEKDGEVFLGMSAGAQPKAHSAQTADRQVSRMQVVSFEVCVITNRLSLEWLRTEGLAGSD